VLVTRAALATPGAGFATRVLERTAPLDLSAPQAIDQFGPPTRAAFAGETPIAAWQTVVDGRSAVRTAHLEGEPMTATFPGAESQHAILDDLLVAPTGAGGGTEASLGGYARVSKTNNLTNFPAAASRTKSNATLIDFGTASADMGVLVGAAIFDASTSGNMLRYGSFTTPVTWSNGAPFTIAIGAGTFGYPSS